MQLAAKTNRPPHCLLGSRRRAAERNKEASAGPAQRGQWTALGIRRQCRGKRVSAIGPRRARAKKAGQLAARGAVNRRAKSGIGPHRAKAIASRCRRSASADLPVALGSFGQFAQDLALSSPDDRTPTRPSRTMNIVDSELLHRKRYRLARTPEQAQRSRSLE